MPRIDMIINGLISEVASVRREIITEKTFKQIRNKL